MKQFKNLLFLSLILLCWTLVSCKSSKTSSGWSLIWEENFNQKKSFDSQVWSKIPRGKSDWNNYMTDFDSCYAMRKGKLVLRGIVNHTQSNASREEHGLPSGCCLKERHGHLAVRLISWNV